MRQFQESKKQKGCWPHCVVTSCFDKPQASKHFQKTVFLAFRSAVVERMLASPWGMDRWTISYNEVLQGSAWHGAKTRGTCRNVQGHTCLQESGSHLISFVLGERFKPRMFWINAIKCFNTIALFSILPYYSYNLCSCVKGITMLLSLIDLLIADLVSQ